jgi:hypothetical protein
VPPHPREPGLVDALALAAAYAEELLVATSRDTHRAVAGRVFGLLSRGTGRPGRATRVVHDAVTAGVYGGLGLTVRAAAGGLSRMGASGIGPRLEDTARGRALRSAVNGLVGDRLRDEHPHLALTMSVRVAGQVVPPQPGPLAAAYPDASDRVVVFVHGLGEHEGHWEAFADRVGATYGSRLADAGWSPVYLRANTGLPVAENGVALASLVQELVEHWPTRVRRLAMVGHSLGGLVVRAACAVAGTAGVGAEPWVERLTDVVTLGTPHLGADLALGAGRGARALAALPEAAAFGRVLDHRSPGIRDLERGLPELPALEHVRYRLVSAALGPERGPVGALLGDLLVRRGSATGTPRRTPLLFPDADVLHLPHAGHFHLLNHPDVHAALERWLA